MVDRPPGSGEGDELTRPLRVLLVSEQSAGMQALRSILSSGHEVRAVLTGTAPSSVGGATVASVAREHGIEIMPPALLEDPGFATTLHEEQIDLLLNVYSLVVAAGPVVAAPRIGSLNMHPAPLPDYAGLNSPCWAVYNGEASHGVTWHWMDAGIDTGPIALATEFPLTGEDTGLTVATRCIREGLELLPELLAGASAGTLPRLPQDLSRRRYLHAAAPEGGTLRWERPAQEIVRFVRACDFGPFGSPWGHPATQLGERRVEVLRATASGRAAEDPPGTVGTISGDSADVAALDEWVAVARVRVGAETLPAARVLRPGDVLTSAPGSS